MIVLQILGLVENMSWFKCPHCGETSFIFGKEGARKTANEMGLEFVGEVCLLIFIHCHSCSCKMMHENACISVYSKIGWINFS